MAISNTCKANQWDFYIFIFFISGMMVDGKAVCVSVRFHMSAQSHIIVEYLKHSAAEQLQPPLEKKKNGYKMLLAIM